MESSLHLLAEHCDIDDIPILFVILVAKYAAQRKKQVRSGNKTLRCGRGAPGHTRRTRPRRDRRTGCLANVVFAQDVESTASLAGEHFRETFRIPHKVFSEIVDLIRGCVWAQKRPTDNAGRPSIPLEILCATSLKRLASGTSYKDLSRCSGASSTVIHTFFDNFCKYFSENRHTWVHGPQTSDEIKRHMGVYNLLGLPGAIGSLDATHIPWERCPESLQSWYTGKEGFKTIAYNCTVGHNTEIFHIASGQPGARNDKTIVHSDKFVLDIRDKRLYGDVEWQRFDENGNLATEVGAYLICDGGYHRWKCLQCPHKHSSCLKSIAYNKLITSVRKDVECCFGRLKARFRILKLPILTQAKDKVDDMFATCCCLHNILLKHDGHIENGTNT
eukprot:m.397151 g.397151  ORF g.397151 m.397151 type:complete len:389 (-) comp21124_c0_seq2:370-1536(-)